MRSHAVQSKLQRLVTECINSVVKKSHKAVAETIQNFTSISTYFIEMSGNEEHKFEYHKKYH